MFEQECNFLSEIRHPNIVQYLGVERDDVSSLSILLMELMDYSLTHFLEQSREPLAYHVQVNINHDIALAVAFLHLNGIAHRDLSSNNVLLIGAGSRANVTDFGMSKLTKLNPHMTNLTKFPGTPAYMSPEALLDPPVYTEKLDCFLIGVLMLQIMTRKFPDPGPTMNRVKDEKFNTGWKISQEPEVKRRHNHLSLVTQAHPLLNLTLDYLKDTDTERPSAQQICQHLSSLKEAHQYTQSLEGKGEERKEEGKMEAVHGGKMREAENQEREELICQLREENEAREKKEREARERLQEVREREKEIECLQVVILEMEEVENIKFDILKRDIEVQSLEVNVQEKENEVRVKTEENKTLNRLIQESEEEVTAKVKEVRKREMEVRLKSDNQSLQQLLQEKYLTIHQLQKKQKFVSSLYLPGQWSRPAISHCQSPNACHSRTE